MPGVGIGVYTGYEAHLHEGEEVSSTYEGRHITVQEQNLIHPDHTTALGNFVQKGDPVIICNTGAPASRGNAVGVAFATATAATDLIAVDTEGIWQLFVESYDDDGGSAIVAGDPLYIHDGSLAAAGALGLGDALISKIRTNVTQIPFGYALGTMVHTGEGTIAVKVHWDPIAHWLLDDEFLQFGDGAGGGPGSGGGGDVSLEYNDATTTLEMLPEANDGSRFNIGNGLLSMDLRVFGMNAATSMLYDSSAGTLDLVNTVLTPGDRAFTVAVTMELPEGEGMCGYFEASLNGQQAGLTYGLHSWLGLGATFVATATVTTPLDLGIWDAVGADLTIARLIFGAQMQCHLNSVPNQYYPWRINVGAALGSITALIQAGNIQSVGYIAAVTENDPPIGYIPLAFIAGIAAAQPCYVRVYDDTD